MKAKKHEANHVALCKKYFSRTKTIRVIYIYIYPLLNEIQRVNPVVKTGWLVCLQEIREPYDHAPS